MVSVATASTLPAMFSAVHLYCPSSTPVTWIILITPPDNTSTLLGMGLLSSLVQLMVGLGMPDLALHWYSTLPPVLMVWLTEGKISILGASLGSTSSMALARAEPPLLSAVQRYIPLSST